MLREKFPKCLMPQNKKGVASCIKYTYLVYESCSSNIDKCGVISVYLRSYSKGFERRQMKLEFNMFPILNDTCMPMDLSKG